MPSLTLALSRRERELVRGSLVTSACTPRSRFNNPVTLRILVSFLMMVALSVPFVHADVVVPPLKARVTDVTSTLSPSQRDSLEQKLAQFERRKGSQVFVLLVPTTSPETVEEYAIRVADTWKPGRK